MNNSLLPHSYQTPLMLELEKLFIDFNNLDIEVIKNFWNPKKCRVDLLPYLAKYLGVLEWDSGWDVEQKRAVCANALMVNKQKGTITALKDALKALKLNATVVEWWMDDKRLKKGTAEINLNEKDVIYGEEQFKSIIRLIDEVKRLGLHINIKKTSAIKGNIYVGGTVNVINRVYV